MVWLHVYDPLGSPLLSTLVAMLPLVVLLGLLAAAGWSAQWAAVAGLATAFVIAVGIVGMPADAAIAAALYGAAFGLFPIGWIILGAMFLYSLSVEAGSLEIIKRSVIQTRLPSPGNGCMVTGKRHDSRPTYSLDWKKRHHQQPKPRRIQRGGR